MTAVIIITISMLPIIINSLDSPPHANTHTQWILPLGARTQMHTHNTQLHPSFLFICLLLNHSLYASLHNYNHLKIIL